MVSTSQPRHKDWRQCILKLQHILRPHSSHYQQYHDAVKASKSFCLCMTHLSAHLSIHPPAYTTKSIYCHWTQHYHNRRLFLCTWEFILLRNWNIKRRAETHCLNLLSIAGSNIDQTKLGSKKFPSGFTLKSHIKGSRGRSSKQEAGGLKERPWRNFTYWLIQLEFLYNSGPPSWALAPHFLHHTQWAEPLHTNY